MMGKKERRTKKKMEVSTTLAIKHILNYLFESFVNDLVHL